MREADAYVRARRGPAFVHARCIRPYSHSLSDDEKLYKLAAEREADARRDPIARFAEFLLTSGVATADRARRHGRRGPQGESTTRPLQGAGRGQAAEVHRDALGLLA